MLRLLIVCAIAACSYAESCCSMEDRQLVLSNWESVWGSQYTGRRITIARAAFEKFFDMDAEAKPLFKGVNVDDMASDEFSAHCIRVVNGFDSIINTAVDSDVLQEQLAHLGEQHAKIPGIKGSFFPTFREAVAEVLRQSIPCFNKAAFLRCIAASHEVIIDSLPA